MRKKIGGIVIKNEQQSTIKPRFSGMETQGKILNSTCAQDQVRALELASSATCKSPAIPTNGTPRPGHETLFKETLEKKKDYYSRIVVALSCNAQPSVKRGYNKKNLGKGRQSSRTDRIVFAYPYKAEPNTQRGYNY